MKTVYTKLINHPILTGAKIDLSKFDKKKTDDKKGNEKVLITPCSQEKAQRIQKNVKPEDVAKAGENRQETITIVKAATTTTEEERIIPVKVVITTTEEEIIPTVKEVRRTGYARGGQGGKSSRWTRW